jgi:hypothetical protein
LYSHLKNKKISFGKPQNVWCVNKGHAKIFLVFCLCIITVYQLQAQSYNFLNVPNQSRISALGAYNVSLTNTDPMLFMNNPAASSDTLGGWAAAGYLFYFADIGMSSFAYRHDDKKLGAFGFAIQHADLGNIDAYDETGAYSGSFNSAETILMINHSRASGNFVFGANSKILFSNIATYRSSALLFDLGGMFVHPEREFTAGLAFKNIGFVLSDYNEVNATTLPWDIQAGITFKPENMPVRFSFTGYDLTRWKNKFLSDESDEGIFNNIMRHTAIGMEIFFHKKITALMGYNHLRRKQLSLEERAGATGFSFGLAGRFSMLDISVAHVIYHAAGTSYQFTLSYNIKSLFKNGNLL